jgi:tRNA-modifying protein YgfZ
MPDLISLKRPSEFLPAAGWIAWPSRSQVRLTGADRAKFLHNFCTNDIKKLQPGQGCEAFLTSIKGRILGHLFVFAGESELTIDTVPGEDVKIRDHLDRYLITEDVQIEVVTDQARCAYVFGEAWPDFLRTAAGIDVDQLPPNGHLLTPRFPVSIRQIDLLSVRGFEFCIETGAADAFMESFVNAGGQASHPVQVAAAAFTAYRIDAGFPMYGVDLTDDHLAQEAARTEKAISFTKGCYLGQEPIARIDALGHVNRELRVVAFSEGDSLVAPVKVQDASTRAELGTLTSIGRVPGSATVGLGVLRTTAKPGVRVVAVTADGEFPGEVVAPAVDADTARG